jgi:hypothetical protein
MIVTFCFVAAEIHSKYTFRFPFRLGHSQGRATLQGRVLTPNSAAPCPGSLDVTPLVVMYFDTYIYNYIYCERVVPFGIACSRCSQWTCGTQCPTIMRAARTFFFLLRGGVLSHRGGGAEHWKWSVPSDQLLHASHSHPPCPTLPDRGSLTFGQRVGHRSKR